MAFKTPKHGASQRETEEDSKVQSSPEASQDWNLSLSPGPSAPLSRHPLHSSGQERKTEGLFAEPLPQAWP